MSGLWRGVAAAALAVLGAGCGGFEAQPGSSNAALTSTATTPIKHVVVIVKENHTFDNYFGSFPGADGISAIPTRDGVIAPPRAPNRMSRDLCHHNECALAAWNGGAMDGWENVVGSSNGGDHLAFAQYREEDIPNYWQYARRFTLADRYFSNQLGPSFPGHLFLLAAQAAWAKENPSLSVVPYWGCDQNGAARVTVEDQATCSEKKVFPCFDMPSVPDVLPAGTSWKFYGSQQFVLDEVWSMFDAIHSVRRGPGWNNVVPLDHFIRDANTGQLPAVSWVVPEDFVSEHPMIGSICEGENATVDLINAVMRTPAWKDTAILLTADDFGGWYDHVPPPRQYGCDPQHPYGLGFRLPLVIISPYAKPGFIFHEQAEQASIPHFIEKIFGATSTLADIDPAAQDKQANDLMNAFDFKQTPLEPLILEKRHCP